MSDHVLMARLRRAKAAHRVAIDNRQVAETAMRAARDRETATHAAVEAAMEAINTAAG